MIVNLAKGRLGTDMANVVGGLITAMVMHAAFSRHDSPGPDPPPVHSLRRRIPFVHHPGLRQPPAEGPQNMASA
ncbi:MAG: hypothetical protein IPO97_13250 [Sphingomonadales bacterium]|nr:hypothetical protein [Sphingomonadales bacterium]